MLRDPRVRKVSFTGSTEVGRILLKEAADGIRNASMELGGNAPFLVCADAAVEAAVEGAMIAKMRGLNRGVVSDPAAPFGGTKASGLGREGAFVGIHEYLETKYTAVSW